MSYTPPSGDNVNFNLTGLYTPPNGDNVNFFGGSEEPGEPTIIPEITIHSISKNKLFSNALRIGFDRSIVKWSSNVTGMYRIEIGGTGVDTGTLFRNGRTIGNFHYRTVINNSDLEGSSAFVGDGVYRFNIYAKYGDNWTPYTEE
jgi:hypothetical protein